MNLEIVFRGGADAVIIEDIEMVRLGEAFVTVEMESGEVKFFANDTVLAMRMLPEEGEHAGAAVDDEDIDVLGEN